MKQYHHKCEEICHQNQPSLAVQPFAYYAPENNNLVPPMPLVIVLQERLPNLLFEETTLENVYNKGLLY